LSAQLEQKSTAAGTGELAGLLAELEQEIGRVRPLLEQAATGAANAAGTAGIAGTAGTT
jgi:hypothetical protein